MKTKRVHVFRVKPDEEIIEAVTQYCQANKITSAIVTGIIGSLQSVKLGFLKELPGKYDTHDFQGPLEIVCAQGTVALCDDQLILHIHIMASNEDGAVGGHLSKGHVFSTAEVVLTELNEQIKRQPDDYTGLNELAETLK